MLGAARVAPACLPALTCRHGTTTLLSALQKGKHLGRCICRERTLQDMPGYHSRCRSIAEARRPSCVQAPRVLCTWWWTGPCGLLRAPCTTTAALSPPTARARAQLTRQSGCCRQVHVHALGALHDIESVPGAWLVLGLLWQGACGCQCMPCAGRRLPALLGTKHNQAGAHLVSTNDKCAPCCRRCSC